MSEVSHITINRSGQVRIPKAIRTRLGLSPGTRLVIETLGDEEIRLRPLRDKPELVEKAGVLVVRSSAAGELEGVEKRERKERLAELMRKAQV